MLHKHEFHIGKAPKGALESAAAKLSGSLPPDGEGRAGGLYETRELQIQALACWARESGLTVAASGLPEMRQPGNEHLLCFDEASNRWIKATLPDRFGFVADMDFQLSATTQRWEGDFILRESLPSEYLERLLLHNEVFADDIRLEAVVTGGRGLQVLTSQPAIVGDAPGHDELRDSMRLLAFRELPGLHLGYRQSLSFFRDKDRVAVFDAHPANAIRHDRLIVPVDFIVQRAGGCLLDAIRSKFPS